MMPFVTLALRTLKITGQLFFVLFMGLALVIPRAYAAPALNFVNLNIEGLSPVFDMIQDHQGFIWLATNEGLSRYDGYQSRHFQHQTKLPGSLPDDLVNTVFEDQQKRLWIGTNAGLGLFEAKTNSFTSPEQGGTQQNRQIRQIVADGKSGLWLATRQGLQHFDPDTETFRIYRHDPAQADSLANDNVDNLALDQQGGLWLATWPEGIDYLPEGSTQFQHYHINTPDNTPQSKNIRALLVDSRQRLWLGSEADVFVWKPGQPWIQKKPLPTPGVSGNFRVHQFVEDSSGIIWAATTVGLLRWDETLQQFAHYQHQRNDPYSLADNHVLSLLMDRSGALVISMSKGISRVDLSLRGFEHLIPSALQGGNENTENSVQTLAPAESGQLWLGSRSSLLLVDLKIRRIVNNLDTHHQKDKWLNHMIYSLYQQPKGPLWIGTNNGLLRYDSRQSHFQTISLGDAACNYINKIVPGGDRTLWLGTGCGLIEYDQTAGVLRKFQHDPLDPHSLANNSVSIIVLDRSNKIWVSGGTISGGGLGVLDPATGKFHYYRFNPDDPASLSSNSIADIKEDPQGSVWLATASGLNQALVAADGSISFRHYHNSTALDLENIKAINIDKAGKIWFNTPGKLEQFDPITQQFSEYHLAEGYYSTDSDNQTTLIDADGSLYFNNVNGLTIVSPEHIQSNQIAPPVAITDIRVFNRSLADGVDSDAVKLEGSITEPRALRLSWYASVFSLHFSALHFSDPQRNQYAYQLEGFDRDWVVTDSSKRMATYTNLDPGHYLFRVKASNNNGIWNETGVSLPITIIPPYWQTLWFRTIVIGTVLGLLIVVYFLRIRQLHLIQARLENQVAQRTEELQSMTQQALAAVEIKSAFLANMSHEIRTPMNAIMGMIYATLQTDLTANQRNYLNKINTSSKWLLGILNDILDFSKLEAGKLKLERTEFSFDTVMQYLADVTSPMLADKSLTLNFELDPNVPSTLIGDPLRLGQILLNLLGNAIKFTEQGSVSLHVQLQASDAQEVSLRFSVIDTGIGLSEEQQSKLFSAFNQADDSTTRQYGGTGLGLSISKDLVDAMGGTINVDSRLGLGSTFYFTVTLGVQVESKSGPLPLQAGAPDKYPTLKNAYVLFVEDDVTISEMIPDILGYEGIRVDLASNGVEAIAMIGKNDYAAVLMDCQMPMMDGFEASRIIRADPRFTDLPIIAMTGNVMDQDQERCFASGMNDHISKPVDWGQFFQTLARWVKPVDAQSVSTLSALQNSDAESNLVQIPVQALSVAPLPAESRTHRQLIAELNVLLANDGFINDELLTQLKRFFPDDQQAEYMSLTQCIIDTDYPKAKAILNTLGGFLNEATETSNQDRRPTILIVDDTRVNLEVLALLLNQDYQVKVAGNGQRALDIAERSLNLDLVLLDVRMPEMDGYEVCQRLKENPLTLSIPVIFVTAAFDQESEIHGLQLGAVDYISKPISPAITLLRVHNHMLIKQHKKELKRIAHYDALTGIPNRVLLADRMKQAIAHTKREQKILAVCYLDLDGFKPINDTFGHQTGDHVLIEIARRIGSTLREGDTVARLGGDEFVVLLPELNHEEECIVTLKRIHETIAQPVVFQEQSISIGASIGVSIYPGDDSDPEALLRYADQAMYAAKKMGKNRYHLFGSTRDHMTSKVVSINVAKPIG
ncbi:MAG: response regulator [Methylobacter sp.]|uniref:Sensory/regulatory protein RpfC n=1 Tax=Candidatus Methylobacter titanis TaxID=3053457 RepID=A0AA43Q7H2_9GAMM|nr:response regulator [Candidatus Methylobacter titanis]